MSRVNSLQVKSILRKTHKSLELMISQDERIMTLFEKWTERLQILEKKIVEMEEIFINESIGEDN